MKTIQAEMKVELKNLVVHLEDSKKSLTNKMCQIEDMISGLQIKQRI